MIYRLIFVDIDYMARRDVLAWLLHRHAVSRCDIFFAFLKQTTRSQPLVMLEVYDASSGDRAAYAALPQFLEYIVFIEDIDFYILIEGEYRASFQNDQLTIRHREDIIADGDRLIFAFYFHMIQAYFSRARRCHGRRRQHQNASATRVARSPLRQAKDIDTPSDVFYAI